MLLPRKPKRVNFQPLFKTDFQFERRGKKREGNGRVMERVNLFKVHCMHV
jgi:hypothetical protein